MYWCVTLEFRVDTYFVYSNNQPIALLSFGASAWMTAPRDQFIGWQTSQREA
ncbi:MAG TPA: DUF4338 domain-containing protein, partial [Desulfobacterales bacterium]|nr:DUF4338 domain-containing protein [Desulfobacterales bacterium]